MVQKLAIPVFGHRISARLDCSESLLLVTIRDNTIVERKELRWTDTHVLHRIHLLLQEGVAVLICGGISDTSARLLRENSIEVIPWVRGEIDEALSSFMQGTLCSPLAGELHGRSSS